MDIFDINLKDEGAKYSKIPLIQLTWDWAGGELSNYLIF